jgi:hypothetical protein
MELLPDGQCGDGTEIELLVIRYANGSHERGR